MMSKEFSCGVFGFNFHILPVYVFNMHPFSFVLFSSDDLPLL